MIESDTIKLLRECDAGIKMGVGSIDDVIGYVKDPALRQSLNKCKDEHERLREDVQMLLKEYHDDGKEPSPVAKGMSWMKTNVKLTMDKTDACIADLITDGCNMGVKSLGRYLNQYEAADEASKNIAKRLIRLEDGLAADVRSYL